MEKQTTVIEINGVKLEVDLRTATRVDQIRVGDRVKVLIKSYSDYAVYPGVVIGFEPFTKLPTIIIAYLETSYSSASIKFLHFNGASKETEVVKAIDNDEMDVDKQKVLATFDKEISTKKSEIEQIEQRKAFFLAEFKNYWRYESVETEEKAMAG